MQKINNLQYLKERRKELRNNSTSAEAVLWNELKNRKTLGLKFRRQASIGNYVVDFYCPEKKIAIEVDGGGHEDVIEKGNDEVRDEFLQSQGLVVIRIKNEEVFNCEGIVECEIMRVLKS